MLQRVATAAELDHLTIERNNLIVERRDQPPLVLDVLIQQIQLIQRSALVALGLTEHFVRLLNLLLQSLLFLLQILDAFGMNRTEEESQRPNHQQSYVYPVFHNHLSSSIFMYLSNRKRFALMGTSSLRGVYVI